MGSEPIVDLQIRGEMLSLVHGARHGCTVVFLEGVFNRAGDHLAVRHLDANLDYLVDRGYLRREVVRDSMTGVERTVYQITSQGTDVLQGLTTDPGVVILGQ